MARFGGKDITQEEFEAIAADFDYDDIGFEREILKYSADSVRKAGEVRYGADWGQHIVGHSEHGPALDVILKSRGMKRKATKLEEWDSLSGRVSVAATGTTGQATLDRAKALGWDSAPSAPTVPPVTDPRTELILATVIELAAEAAARDKLASLQVVAKEVGAAVGKITGGAPVRKIKAELDKLLKAVG